MVSAKKIKSLARKSRLLLCLQCLAGTVAALRGDSWCGDLMCVTATVDGTSSTVTYELKALNQLGWMAIGFGTHMAGTPLIILWLNEDGSVTLSQRNATGHVQPKPLSSPSINATLHPNQAAWNQQTSPSLLFDVPSNNDTFLNLVWAFGTTRPDPDSSAQLEQHLDAGGFTLNLTNELAEPTLTPSPTAAPLITNPSSQPSAFSGPLVRHEKLIVAHAILVWIGFLVLLPAGALVARWGRVFTPHWLRAHWILNTVVGLPVIALGWALAPLAVADHGTAHFRDGHEIGGIVLLLLFCIQLVLGRYIQKRRPIRNIGAHPPPNIVHMILGVFTIGLAFYQTRSGLLEWTRATGRSISRVLPVVWAVWVVVLPSAYLLGLALLPRQILQERLGMTPLPPLPPRYKHAPVGSRATTPRTPPPSPPPADDGTHDVYSEIARASAERRRAAAAAAAAAAEDIPMRELPAAVPIAVQVPRTL